ncbi:MAG: hypothetical protein V2I36_07255 [Desulfopila sp.]|jgi:hypothetical protein|nr:hypothetical protein [Desulfopila sp.]
MNILFRIVIIVSYCFLYSVSLSCAVESRESIRQSLEEKSIDVAHIDQKRLKHLSEDEKKWYNKFQNGLVFFSGWKDISEDILACVEPEEQNKTKELLETLGIRIGTEWSKDNTIRRIDTEQLQNWGDMLREARNNGPTYLSAALEELSQEVDSILSQPHKTTHR